MTKRIISGVFILVALGALGVILAGALTSGEQLIVRFLTAIIVAALGLYVISDLRLQADDEAAAGANRARLGGVGASRSVSDPPLHSTAAFMATVTGKRSAQAMAELDDTVWARPPAASAGAVPRGPATPSAADDGSAAADLDPADLDSDGAGLWHADVEQISLSEAVRLAGASEPTVRLSSRVIPVHAGGAADRPNGHPRPLDSAKRRPMGPGASEIFTNDVSAFTGWEAPPPPDHAGQAAGDGSPYADGEDRVPVWPLTPDGRPVEEAPSGDLANSEIEGLVRSFAKKSEQEQARRQLDVVAASPGATDHPLPADGSEPATPAEPAGPAGTAGERPTGIVSTSETGDPASTTSETGDPASTTSETGDPASTTTETGDPASTTTETGDPASTTTETGDPASTTTETGDPASTTTETGDPANTTSETGDHPASAAEGTGDHPASATEGEGGPASGVDAAGGRGPARGARPSLFGSALGTGAMARIEAAAYARAPIAPIIDLRSRAANSTDVEAAIRSGELEIIASLIEQGLLSTEGPISDRDVRTMVYVAFTSSELRKILLAGGTIDGDNSGLDLGQIELFHPQASLRLPSLGTGSVFTINLRDEPDSNSQAL